MNRNLVLLFVCALMLCGCASASRDVRMGQVQLKQLETRTIDAEYDKVFSAAIEALFDLGFNIVHSDKLGGIVTGEKQKSRKVYSGGVSFVWYEPHVMYQPTVYSISILIKKVSDCSTNIRIKMTEDGNPVLDRRAVDRIWVYMDRQVMMETSPTDIAENKNSKIRPAEIDFPAKKYNPDNDVVINRAIPVADRI